MLVFTTNFIPPLGDVKHAYVYLSHSNRLLRSLKSVFELSFLSISMTINPVCLFTFRSSYFIETCNWEICYRKQSLFRNGKSFDLLLISWITSLIFTCFPPLVCSMLHRPWSFVDHYRQDYFDSCLYSHERFTEFTLSKSSVFNNG